MSEVTLTILDWDRAIHGRTHGSDADRAIAALSAEPDTIDELDRALCRFTGRTLPCKQQADSVPGHFSYYRPGVCEELWDAGVVIIDLAARLIAGKSTYSALATSGSVLDGSPDSDPRIRIEFRLSSDWQVCRDFDGWRARSEQRREERRNQSRIDVRSILLGRPMVEFAVSQLQEYRNLDAEEAIRHVHAKWLMTARGDLGGKAPRELLLEKQTYLDWETQNRQFQWSESGKCPPGLDLDTDAYRYAGFGTEEIVVYYDLMRAMLAECRARFEQEGVVPVDEEIKRLEVFRDGWLSTPNPEYQGSIPQQLIENERRRTPNAMTGEDAMIDPDCPCCQMMAESGPCFWNLDGSHMDEDFAFSFHKTVEDWEAERREWEAFERKWEEKRQQEKLGVSAKPRIWHSVFISDDCIDDLPVAQMVAATTFGFASMAGELRLDIEKLAENESVATSQKETLNRLVSNLGTALADSPELIDPSNERLVEELADLAQQYPSLEPKCTDFTRRLEKFMAQLRECDGIV